MTMLNEKRHLVLFLVTEVLFFKPSLHLTYRDTFYCQQPHDRFWDVYKPESGSPIVVTMILGTPTHTSSCPSALPTSSPILIAALPGSVDTLTPFG